MTIESADVAVIGAGVIGLGVARALAPGRGARCWSSRPSGGRHAHQLAQLRGDPRRHLLPEGLAQGPALRRGRRRSTPTAPSAASPTPARASSSSPPWRRRSPRSPSSRPRRRPTASPTSSCSRKRRSTTLEPDVSCVRGLLSPSTGIIDSHALMASLKRDAEAAGAQVALGTPVRSGRVGEGGIELSAGDDGLAVRFRLVVNCAGPWAQQVARRIEGVPASAIPPQHFAKGHYFVMPGRSPLPSPDLSGAGPRRAGHAPHPRSRRPGAVRSRRAVVRRSGLRFDEGAGSGFYASIRRYYPRLPDGALVPGFTGVRPKTGSGGEPGAGLPNRGAAAARGAGPGEPVRHRVPGADLGAGHRRPRAPSRGRSERGFRRRRPR